MIIVSEWSAISLIFKEPHIRSVFSFLIIFLDKRKEGFRCVFDVFRILYVYVLYLYKTCTEPMVNKYINPYILQPE